MNDEIKKAFEDYLNNDPYGRIKHTERIACFVDFQAGYKSAKSTMEQEITDQHDRYVEKVEELEKEILNLKEKIKEDPTFKDWEWWEKMGYGD